MNKQSTAHTPGSPVRNSVLLAAYSLLWVGVLIYSAETITSHCDYLWANFGLLMLWSMTTIVLLVVSVILVLRYIKRIRYLRSKKQKIPLSYGVMFILLPVALSTFLWTNPITNDIYTRKSLRAASTTMDTIDKFTTAAQDCRINDVYYWYNSYDHKATDSNAYIQVYLSGTDYDNSTLYYSYSQKDDLQKISDKFASGCQEKHASDYSATYVGAAVWNTAIKTYSPGC